MFLTTLVIACVGLSQTARPRDVWVFRSVLDGRPGLVTCALSKDIWVAYDPRTCGIYKAWKGDVNFTGPVFDGSDTGSPTTRGQTYLPEVGQSSPWILRTPLGVGPLAPRFRGYILSGSSVRLLYEVPIGEGKSALVYESPESPPLQNGRAPFLRRFEVQGLPSGYEIGLTTSAGIVYDPPNDIYAEGTWEVGKVEAMDRDYRRVTGTFWLRSTGTSTLASLFAPIEQTGPQKIYDPSLLRTSKEEQGLTLKVYELAGPITAIPRITPGELPNVNKKISKVDLKSKDDFGGYEDNFFAEVSGTIRITESGRYTFRLTSDEGSRLVLGGRLLIDHDGRHLATESKEATVELRPGEQTLLLEYFEADGDQALKLEWKRPKSQTFEVIPDRVFWTPTVADRPTASGAKTVFKAAPMAVPGDRSPLTEIHPSFDFVALVPEQKLKVTGMDFLEDDRLLVATWDANGSVYLLDNVLGDAKEVTAKRIAAGLCEPMGIKTIGKNIYVLQKHELTRLIDHNGNDTIDEYYAFAGGWGASDSAWEFAFGPLLFEGLFHIGLSLATEPSGVTRRTQMTDRGKIIRLDRSGNFSPLASGLRMPQGLALGPKEEILSVDHQGEWCPSPKVVRIKPDRFYGNRLSDAATTGSLPESAPVVWLPFGEVARSPSSLLSIRSGVFANQVLIGDMVYGGIQRLFVEEVGGELQGAVFRFAQGLPAGVQCMVWGPDDSLFVGGLGFSQRWSQPGKDRQGLFRLKPTGRDSFDMKAIRAKTNGLEIEFTEPLKLGAGISASDYTVRQWRYVPSAAFGGPKQDDLILAINSVTISPDRTRAFLELLDIAEGNVMHVHVSPFVRSAEDRPLWTTEGWYTLNQIPKNVIVKPAPAKPTPITGLTEEEKQAGFEVFFDGKDISRWRGWRKTNLPSAWSAEKGELRLIPGSGESGDLCTVDEFDDFELRLEWRIGFGGNSGIFYRASETYEKPWESGPEMQVLDNDRHADGTKPETSAGSCYAMFAPAPHLLQRVGEFNEVRIVAKGERITHFLNGWKVVEYDLWTPEWQLRKEATLFSEIPNYGMIRKGRIVLQDHGSEVAFRNIRIKRLP